MQKRNSRVIRELNVFPFQSFSQRYKKINTVNKFEHKLPRTATNTRLKLTRLGNSRRRAVNCMCLRWHQRGFRKASWRANGGCADAIGWADRHSTLCHIVGYPWKTTKEQDNKLCREQPCHLLESSFLKDIQLGQLQFVIYHRRSLITSNSVKDIC